MTNPHKNPNPQGKGLSASTALISALNASSFCPAKSIEQISNELFTSLFILHSRFKFKPVIGKSYWLYQSEKQFRLSMVSPEEWSQQAFGIYIGQCELHVDMIWSLELSEWAKQNDRFSQFLKKKREQFDRQLRQSRSLLDGLPAYQAKLPYYQRAFCSALSYSLSRSMMKSGIARLNYEQAVLKLE